MVAVVIMAVVVTVAGMAEAGIMAVEVITAAITVDVGAVSARLLSFRTAACGGVLAGTPIRSSSNGRAPS
ncbi:MAG: hypothetical protein PHS14_17475 [Elusimicrobia bacterium]|nr:hypothetical protein [Elusimicrobiota bacterium]